MQITIGKHFEFEACHNLPDEDVYGSCRNQHGHRYEMRIEVMGNVSELGWVCNFKEIKDIVNENVLNKYDHSNLNDYFEIPTAENIVIEIFKRLDEAFINKPYKLKNIKLYETSSSYAQISYEDFENKESR